MKSHPAIIAAMDALISLRNSETGKWLNDEQARNIITVEVTPRGMTELITQSDDYRWRTYRLPVGPVTIMGIRCYIVHHLPDGDEWRVLNALGVN